MFRCVLLIPTDFFVLLGPFVLSSFHFSLAHTASFFSHDARIARSKTNTLLSEIN